MANEGANEETEKIVEVLSRIGISSNEVFKDLVDSPNRLSLK